MPSYDYKCKDCGSVKTEYTREHSDRLRPLECECGGSKEWQFPVGAAMGFQPFESEFDESLGCDIHGRRHRKEVMRSQGVIEAGDKRHGARFMYDHASGTSPLQGVKHSDNQRRADIALERAGNETITVMNKDESERTEKVKNVGTNTKEAFKTKITMPKE